MKIVKEKLQMNMTSKNIEGVEKIYFHLWYRGGSKAFSKRGGLFLLNLTKFSNEKGGFRVRTPPTDMPKCY
jgi:hypothetical protein